MKKAFPIEIVLSLTTGRLLKHGGFGDMQELAEHVLGHPVWTHEFADKGTVARMTEAVLAQHPTLRDAEVFDAKAAKRSLDTYLAGYVERATVTFGAMLDIESGTQRRTESPLASAQRLMPGKPILAVEVDEPVGTRS